MLLWSPLEVRLPIPNMCLFISTMVFVPMMLTSDDLILEHQHTKVGGEFAAFWQGLIYYYIFAAAGCFHSREKLSSHSPGGLWRLLNSTFIETPFHSSSTPWSMVEKKECNGNNIATMVQNVVLGLSIRKVHHLYFSIQCLLSS